MQWRIDIFGPDPVSADCAAYVRKDTITKTRLTQNEVSGNVSGTLFNLPAGELKTAITADYRENTYRVDPDAALQAGDIASVVAVQPTSGKTHVAEIAVELLIPMIKNAPLIKSLNFTPGYRYSKYSPGGRASTNKLNLDGAWSTCSCYAAVISVRCARRISANCTSRRAASW